MADPALTERLRQILREPTPQVLVGILPLYDDHPVAAPWLSRADTTQRYGSEKWARKYLADAAYGCAAVTRMCSWALGDHAAWWRKVRQIWSGRDVLLVAGSKKGLAGERMLRGDVKIAVDPGDQPEHQRLDALFVDPELLPRLGRGTRGRPGAGGPGGECDRAGL